MAEKTNSRIRHLSEESFEQEISSGLNLIDFFADWCGPCRLLTPVLERVAQEVEGKAKIAKIDVDSAQKIATTYQVTSIPTLVLFNQGKEVGRLVGLKDADTILKFILKATS